MINTEFGLLLYLIGESDCNAVCGGVSKNIWSEVKRRGPKRRKRGGKAFVLCVAVSLVSLQLLLWAGCFTRDARRSPARRVSEADARVVQLEVTGYCACGSCTGWRRNWWGRPVYSYGNRRGQRKQVGLTASGSQARPGTIAADTRHYPFGTIMYVPGYGYGEVADRGGAIKGQKIDLYFNTHQEALEWGRQHKQVKVWLP